MSVTRSLRTLGLIGGLGLAGAALAEDPLPLPVIKPVGLSTPPPTIPLVDAPPVKPVPSVAKVKVAATALNAADALPKTLAESREAVAKLRDYTCHLIREERVNGKLLPEQVTELRVRTAPFSVNVKAVSPKAVAGEETSFRSALSEKTARYRMGGVDGVKYGFRTTPIDDPRALSNTRHTIADVGLRAVLDRVETILQTEKRLKHPIQVLQSEYTFANRPCLRFEIFTEHPHPSRYAHHLVLFVDKETKLPVRFEAYDEPKTLGSEGDRIEVQSFISMKTNAGLGEAAFDR